MLLDLEHPLIMRVSRHVKSCMHIPRSTASLGVGSAINKKSISQSVEHEHASEHFRVLRACKHACTTVLQDH